MGAENNIPPRFELSKFYFDCIAKNGDAIIVYAARLRWHKLFLSYISLLENPNTGKTKSKTVLKTFSDPSCKNTTCSFDIPSLKFTGNWNSGNPLSKQSLIESGDGSITWNCFAPHATAEIEVAGKKISGLGYAEHLYMTMEPWKMPINELRWGRFLSETDSVVWIQWNGSHPLNLIWHNGIPILGKTLFSETHISFGNISISLHQQQDLRQGALLKTALKPLKRFMRFFPSSILNTHESKWISSAELIIDGKTKSKGFALHELVIFPKT